MPNAERGAKFLDTETQRLPRLTSPLDHLEAVRELWRNGMPSGEKTGWATLDKYYTVMPGQLTVVTGWPGSGKSEFIDALCLNLSKMGWKFAMFSFENQPVAFHVSKYLEKLAGKPFGRGRNERIADGELNELMDELTQSFAFTAASNNSFRLHDTLKAAERFLSQFPESKKGVVIDPWNELEHWREQGLSETEYISKTLSAIRNWARNNTVHVWLIAHPAKTRRDDGGRLPVPKPDMISGSQHFWNKADCCITVWRDAEKPDAPEVDIHIQKMRFKHIGRVGMVTLHYDRVTGKYHDKIGSF